MRNELPYSGLAYDIGTYEPDDLVLETAEGAVASFDNGADDLPLKSLVVNIEPKQSGSGEPSSVNNRPIVGWSEVTVEQSGKNLLDPSAKLDTSNKSNVYFYHTTGKWLPPGTYTLSFKGGYILSGMYIREKPSATNIAFAYNTDKLTFTLTEGKTVEVDFYRASGITDTSINLFQLEEGSTSTDYEPYQGESKSTDFKDENGNPITVYECDIDVVKGKGETETQRILIADYPYISSTNISGNVGDIEFYLYNLPHRAQIFLSTQIDPNLMCNVLTPKTANDTYRGMKGIASGSGYIYLYDPDIQTIEDLRAFARENNMEILYTVRDPIPIYCDPIEIKSLKGSNNVWSDAGAVNVDYLPQVEKNTFPYSGTKYYVGVFEPIEEEEATTDTPLNITPIDEPINLTHIDEPIDITPIEPIDEPIVPTETEEIDNG